jgi:5-methylcytosine-specific restriction endonuclease McrA
MLPKPRPRALVRKDRKRNELQHYKEQRALAMTRDAKHCRICGGMYALETHHVEPRSQSGPKRKVEAHDKSNLLTVCRDCHRMVTEKLLKVIPTTDQGADGPVRILKYSDADRGYVVWKRAA